MVAAGLVVAALVGTAALVLAWRARRTADALVPMSAETSAEPSRVLGTTRAADGAVLIDVVALERPSRDIVEVRLTVGNADPARPVVLGGRFADREDEAGSLSGAWLTAGATARYFVLRDNRGRPACSSDLAALGPGERRAAWIRFGSPGRARGAITLHVPGAPPVAGLELPEAR
jgi:hypothetical protein